MEGIEGLEFDSIGGIGDAFGVQATPSDCTWIVSAIEQAAREGRLVAIKEAFAALRRTGVDQNWLQRPGSALFLAVEHTRKDVVDYLLSEGVHISSNPVKVATSKRNVAILELFLNHGGDVNEQTEWSIPPALA